MVRTSGPSRDPSKLIKTLLDFGDNLVTMYIEIIYRSVSFRPAVLVCTLEDVRLLARTELRYFVC